MHSPSVDAASLPGCDNGRIALCLGEHMRLDAHVEDGGALHRLQRVMSWREDVRTETVRGALDPMPPVRIGQRIGVEMLYGTDRVAHPAAGIDHKLAQDPKRPAGAPIAAVATVTACLPCNARSMMKWPRSMKVFITPETLLA